MKNIPLGGYGALMVERLEALGAGEVEVVETEGPAPSRFVALLGIGGACVWREDGDPAFCTGRGDTRAGALEDLWFVYSSAQRVSADAYAQPRACVRWSFEDKRWEPVPG